MQLYALLHHPQGIAEQVLLSLVHPSWPVHGQANAPDAAIDGALCKNGILAALSDFRQSK